MIEILTVTPPPAILRLKGLDGEWIVHRQVGDTLYLFKRSPTGYEDGFFDPDYGDDNAGDYFEGYDGGPLRYVVRAAGRSKIKSPG